MVSIEAIYFVKVLKIKLCCKYVYFRESKMEEEFPGLRSQMTQTGQLTFGSKTANVRQKLVSFIELDLQ